MCNFLLIYVENLKINGVFFVVFVFTWNIITRGTFKYSPNLIKKSF